MKLDSADVDRIAALAALQLDPHERDQLAGELTKILSYVDAIAAYPLPVAIDPAASDRSALRSDQPRTVLDATEVAAAAPRFENGFFVVPRVLGGA